MVCIWQLRCIIWSLCRCFCLLGEVCVRSIFSDSRSTDLNSVSSLHTLHQQQRDVIIHTMHVMRTTQFLPAWSLRARQNSRRLDGLRFHLTHSQHSLIPDTHRRPSFDDDQPALHLYNIFIPRRSQESGCGCAHSRLVAAPLNPGQKPTETFESTTRTKLDQDRRQKERA